jgi:hypothetical protein
MVEKRGSKLPIRVPLTTVSTAQLVRPLRAYERTIHHIMEAYPLHFSLVAEVAGALEPERFRQALGVVEHRHPTHGHSHYASPYISALLINQLIG